MFLSLRPLTDSDSEAFPGLAQTGTALRLTSNLDDLFEGDSDTLVGFSQPLVSGGQRLISRLKPAPCIGSPRLQRRQQARRRLGRQIRVVAAAARRRRR